MNLRDVLFFFTRPQGSKLPQQVQKLKNFSEDIYNQLITWHPDELELISFQLANVSPKRKDKAREWKGIITSIFHESLFIIVVRKLNKTGSNALVLIRNSDIDWVFRIKDRTSLVYINGQGAARIKSDGTMVPFKRAGILGKATSNTYGNSILSIKGNEIGEVNKFEEDAGFNQRAITVIKDFEDDGERLLFLTLALHRISQLLIK